MHYIANIKYGALMQKYLNTFICIFFLSISLTGCGSKSSDSDDKDHPLNTNANLSDLSISPGTLSPTFSTDTATYTVELEYSISSITVTPESDDAKATVKVEDITVTSGNASGAITLDIGENIINVIVTAEDQITTKKYTIVATRLEYANADLSALTLSSINLTPIFSTEITNYTAYVSQSVSSITVTPVTLKTVATVKVNNVTVTSGTVSDPIALTPGGNTINIDVTNGTSTKNYKVVVTKLTGANALLSYIDVSFTELSPLFTSNTENYTSKVLSSIESITVIPIVSDSSSTVTVNGTAVISGKPSDPISLDFGENTVTLIVTAEDSTTETYEIIITREQPLVQNQLQGYWYETDIYYYSAGRNEKQGDYDDQWRKVGAIFSESSVILVADIYYGSTHDTAFGNWIARYARTSSYSMGNTVSVPAESTEIDLMKKKATLTFFSKDYTDWANSVKYYGYTDWAAGIAKDITGRTDDLGFTESAADTMCFNVMKLTVGTPYSIQFGNLEVDTNYNGSTASKRPQVLNRSLTKFE